ncbi:PREDICTED: beta-hexosaminidase subunit beta-like [Eufriesea mexicana]|uniref:beta-hexosaminidase subunit beta-like n=1 Tax=Eufriesea mexicana TaxID=516756 RepID=UPI00083C6216|nr:PREDICTED: beta-hexosaminidase subunit beta-like [Eufriesea mexicana]
MRTRLPRLFLLLGSVSCLLLGLLSCLLLLPVQRVDALNSDSGAWVQATQGEVWPLPNFRRLSKAYYLLRASTFQFNVIGETCDIVTDALERYKAIILTDARIAKISTQGQARSSARNNGTVKGTLSSLDIQLAEPCEKDGNHWPYLHMKESYSLSINETSTAANLAAESVWGVLRGLETFSQLLTPAGDGSNLKIRCQTIVDRPKLPHRGLLMDTSRHYLPISDILLTLDAMSYNKMNVLHWHIVDDNSFPYQSSSFPELSAKGAYHPLMVYTLNDIQKIVDYARLRGIRVMPEFDTPGHTRSWGLAYPELLTACYDLKGKANGKLGPMNPTNPKLYEFLRQLFAEIVQVFPDQYVHLGGDEVPFNCWMSNPSINAYMKTRNISNYAQLENEYIGKLLQITDSLQASTIVWQEVFENGVLMPNSTVIDVWTGLWAMKLKEATQAGHPVLLSACWYLDNIAGGGDWKKFYRCDPLSFDGAQNVTHLMLGGEACMWGEYVDRNNVHSRIWPRASASAERLWSNLKQDENKASQRLEEHACRMNRRGIPAQPPNGPGFCVM